jgi:pimeloyl-ACP methyl ester carboxylesterase
MNFFWFYPFFFSLTACLFIPVKAEGADSMITNKMLYKVTGDGKPLVLIPGGLTGWVSWDSFVPEFSSEYKVVQVQLLNVQYGMENKELPENYSVRMESQALAESLNELKIDFPADFIGWSFGSFVLLDFALNNPQLVKSITLIEPPAFWILKEENKINSEIQEIINFMKSLTGDISEDQLEKFMTTVGFAPPGTSLRGMTQWNTWVKFRKSLRNCGYVTMHDDNLTRLHKLKFPVLLVKGTGSAPFLHEIIDGLNQHLPNVRLIQLEGGHSPHIFSKEEFLRNWREFLKEN